MRRSALIGIAVAGILLAACNAEAQQPSQPNIQPASPPNITVNTGETQTGISVTGTGEVTGTPDTVEIDIGVSVLGKTVEEATSNAAEKAEVLIAALTANGVAEEDITTTNYSIYPEYDYRSGQERLIGYRVNNTVRAKIRDIGESGSVIDAATAAGGDDVRVSSLRFSIEDNTDLVEAAREVAWNDALAKATQLAELSGQTLGAALFISETVSAPPVPIFFDRSLTSTLSGDFETPIQPGTSAVTIRLSVHFAFESCSWLNGAVHGPGRHTELVVLDNPGRMLLVRAGRA